MVDVGGYYKFRDPGFQLLFCYGHSALGPSEHYGYWGCIGRGARRSRMIPVDLTRDFWVFRAKALESA